MASVTPAVQCAQAIVPLVGAELGITFVAIAGCESSFGTNNWGDCNLSGPSCRGCTSIGAWQINMPAHAGYLQSVTGSTDPCTWANWLLNLHNNAVAAVHVFHAAGSTFHPVGRAGSGSTATATASRRTVRARTRKGGKGSPKNWGTYRRR